MQFHKINDNKLQILITDQDLTKINFKQQDFMACKIQNESFLLDIIKYAKQNLGYNFNNKEILVESFSVPKLKSFIINITALPKRININKKTKYKMNCCFIIKFYSFQNLCAFCNTLDYKNTSSLYSFNNIYYLTIKIIHIREYKKVLMTLKEFADGYKVHNFINENSDLIIKDNAIDICKKFS